MPRRVDWTGATVRRCASCSGTKPLSEFGIRSNRLGDPAPRWICKSCYNLREAERYRQKALHNKALYGFTVGSPERRCELSMRMREGNARLKTDVISAYGSKCSCCGIDEESVLTIDHTEGNGADERRLYGSGANFYRHLRDTGYPQNGYRVLCWNCNTSIGLYGYCPHQHGSSFCSSMAKLSRSARCQRRLRSETMLAYGGKCERCGESFPEFLVVAYKRKGSIITERRRRGVATDSSSVCRWLRSSGYPRDQFRLLCWNCEMGLVVTHGKEQREDDCVLSKKVKEAKG